MKWTFTTTVKNKRKDGLPDRGGKISITLEIDETRPGEVTLSLYHRGMLYTEGNISVAASIMPLSAIVEEVENQDERNLHRDEIMAQVKNFVKAFHLLEQSGQSGAVATFAFLLDTPGKIAH